MAEHATEFRLNMIHRILALGQPRYSSPLKSFVSDDSFVPEHIVRDLGPTPQEHSGFELAGPRAKLFFDPARTRAGIVTCGGLCPGLNNVIRSLFNELHHAYGVQEVLGFRGGYPGLDPAHGQAPIRLTAEGVDGIHRRGGR